MSVGLIFVAVTVAALAVHMLTMGREDDRDIMALFDKERQETEERR